MRRIGFVLFCFFQTAGQSDHYEGERKGGSLGMKDLMLQHSLKMVWPFPWESPGQSLHWRSLASLRSELTLSWILSVLKSPGAAPRKHGLTQVPCAFRGQQLGAFGQIFSVQSRAEHAFSLLFPLITAFWCWKHYNPHFTVKEREVQRGWVVFLQSHRWVCSGDGIKTQISLTFELQLFTFLFRLLGKQSQKWHSIIIFNPELWY